MLLEKMEETTGILHGQNLYGMIQGGMFYVHTHECAIDTLRNFADKNNVVFRGGFVMGGGAPLNGRPLEEVIGAKQTVPAVNAFIENIKENRNSPRDLYLKAAMKVPAFMAWILVTMMNRKLKKEFEAKGIDYRIK